MLCAVKTHSLSAECLPKTPLHQCSKATAPRGLLCPNCMIWLQHFCCRFSYCQMLQLLPCHHNFPVLALPTKSTPANVANTSSTVIAINKDTCGVCLLIRCIAHTLACVPVCRLPLPVNLMGCPRALHAECPFYPRLDKQKPFVFLAEGLFCWLEGRSRVDEGADNGAQLQIRKVL